MNAHKGILIEMKCDHSFEITHLFTEGILERGEATAPFVSSVFYPQTERNPFPLWQVHIDLLSDVMLDFVWFAPAAAIILETLPSDIRVGL